MISLGGQPYNKEVLVNSKEGKDSWVDEISQQYDIFPRAHTIEYPFCIISITVTFNIDDKIATKR